MNKNTLDENSKWLIDGDECDIIIWNDNIIQVTTKIHKPYCQVYD